MESVSIVSYAAGSGGTLIEEENSGVPVVIKPPAAAGDGAGFLIVDDLVDTGTTARVVRGLLPKAHFASGVRQAGGAAVGGRLHHRGVAGHLDPVPVGHRAAVRRAAGEARRVARRPVNPPWVAPGDASRAPTDRHSRSAMPTAPDTPGRRSAAKSGSPPAVNPFGTAAAHRSKKFTHRVNIAGVVFWSIEATGCRRQHRRRQQRVHALDRGVEVAASSAPARPALSDIPSTRSPPPRAPAAARPGPAAARCRRRGRRARHRPRRR